MNFEEKTSDKVQFSEGGASIAPGEIYFEGELHGRTGRFNVREYEKFLGLTDYSADERKQLAKEGKALSDGSFPIKNCKDASNAIHRIGTGSNNSKSTIVAHIRKRVKALGCSGSTFENYK